MLKRYYIINSPKNILRHLSLVLALKLHRDPKTTGANSGHKDLKFRHFIDFLASPKQNLSLDSKPDRSFFSFQILNLHLLQICINGGYSLSLIQTRKQKKKAFLLKLFHYVNGGSSKRQVLLFLLLPHNLLYSTFHFAVVRQRVSGYR